MHRQAVPQHHGCRRMAQIVKALVPQSRSAKNRFVRLAQIVGINRGASNAASGLRFRGVGKRDSEQRARTWLEQFGVGHLASQNARTLSGGEAQRVSLARAFAVEPDLLLRLKRSITTPATGPSRRTGRISAATNAATATPCPVSW
ncbi:MAG: ATP-binding cassette domain-containing protein [Chloroflexia bacterium]|nr:ATP-binding cassette domain-containing protein [Chloroflexia bacterium]